MAYPKALILWQKTIREHRALSNGRGPKAQTVWIKIGLAFLAFYVAEAILFWQGLGLAVPLIRRLPLGCPVIWPLGYWGLFGVVVYLLQRREMSCQERDPAVARFHRWQGALLTAAITTGAIGVAFVVIRGSGSTPLGHTLGHSALFFALFLSAAVIGAMELNFGWLSAAVIWLITAVAIYCYPAGVRLTHPFKDEDILIGLAMVLGCFLIGAFPQHVDRQWLDSREGDGASRP